MSFLSPLVAMRGDFVPLFQETLSCDTHSSSRAVSPSELNMEGVLLSAAFDFALVLSMPWPSDKPVPGKQPFPGGTLAIAKINVNGGGQECPPHTDAAPAGS
jgi:hypothetical protein